MRFILHIKQTICVSQAMQYLNNLKSERGSATSETLEEDNVSSEVCTAVYFFVLHSCEQPLKLYTIIKTFFL